nr:MAG TPA: hypothetical protein [Caudoviricetes sp.]
MRCFCDIPVFLHSSLTRSLNLDTFNKILHLDLCVMLNLIFFRFST